MQIDIIEDLETFRQIKGNWDAVYDADPEAQLFLSWPWLARWLAQLEGPWFILAARSDVPNDRGYVAFFPMRLRTKMTRSGAFFNEINMAGNYAADYTGLICIPAMEERAIPAFARVLTRMNWTRIHFENLRIGERRARLLLAHFPNRIFRSVEVEHIGKLDNINNCICPSAALPADWDRYLMGLSTNTRQKIRRLLKTVEMDDDYRISHATADSIGNDLDVLLRLWKSRWGARKGSRVDTIVRSNRAMLLNCFESGLLLLPTLWKAGSPVGALAILCDARKRSLLFYMAGRDESFDGPSPGLVLHAHTIRHAISNGFLRYDFLRGNEPYKYSFNVEEHRIRCVKIATRTGQNLGNKLDRRSLPSVLHRATGLHQAGHLVEAERGYRQILDNDPSHRDALYRLGQLKAGCGEHGAARRLFLSLVAAYPAPKAWLWLAKSCRALGRHDEAAWALHEATLLQNGALRSPLGSSTNSPVVLAGRMMKPGASSASTSAAAINLQQRQAETR